MSNELSTKQEAVAVQVARAEKTIDGIAAAFGLNRKTVDRWIRQPAFKARIDAEVSAITAAIRAEGIANRQNRVDAYNDRWRKLQQVISERAQAPDMQDVPGGTTGLLVKTWKQVGTGRAAQFVAEYEVDTATLAEMRATEKQAAQELKQWNDESNDGDSSSGRPATNIQIAVIDYRTSILPLAPSDAAAGPVGYRDAPGQDEGFSDGSALGENGTRRRLGPGRRA